MRSSELLFISPLRYPGGKRKLGPYFARLLAAQPVQVSAYAEPYAGGAGAGLYLLAEGHIDELIINDLNPGIAAFWRAVVHDAESFIRAIEAVEVSVDVWAEMREVYLAPSGRSDLELGFATFFLNRCNRSGILGARPIGGLDQKGRWKIDARFNREDLIKRISYISGLSSSIKLSELPALTFIKNISRRRSPVLTYVDPPYFVQGEELYLSMHSWSDHERLAQILEKTKHPWVLTYDADDRVRHLYPSKRCLQYGISHTAHDRKIGMEYMLFSRGLRVMDENVAAKRKGEWLPQG